MRINYVTSNAGKFTEAQVILPQWELLHTPLDLPEIQGTAEEITFDKYLKAKAHLNTPFIVEDVSLLLSALGGFPGPYIKPMLSTLGALGVYDLVHRYNNYKASAMCHVAYFDPQYAQPILCSGTVDGMIVFPRSGPTQHGTVHFTSIFVPFGHEKSFAEMSFDEIAKCSMRGIALTQLKKTIEALCLHVN